MKIHFNYAFFAAVLFFWSLLGYPFFASTALALGLDTSLLMIGLRGAFVLLCVVLILFHPKSRSHESTLTFWLMTAFFLVYCLRLAFDTAFDPAALRQSPFYYWSFTIGVSFLPAITLSMYVNYLNIKKQSPALIGGGIIILLIAVAVGGTIVRSTSGEIYDTGRLSLEALNPISLGHVGATVIVLGYWRQRMLGGSFAGLCLWLPTVMLGFYVVLAAGSRGPLVALIFALLFFEAVKGGRTLLVLSIAAVPLIAVLTIDLSQIEKFFGTNIFSRFESAVLIGDASSQARIEQIESAWRLFLDHPFFGAALEDPSYGIYPHNVVVEAFMAVGVLGGFLLVILLCVCIFQAFQLARSNSVLSVFGALLIQYIFAAQLSGGLYGSSVMWALVGCMAGLQGRHLKSSVTAKVVGQKVRHAIDLRSTHYNQAW